jgi:hypothetical protein
LMVLQAVESVREDIWLIPDRQRYLCFLSGSSRRDVHSDTGNRTIVDEIQIETNDA